MKTLPVNRRQIRKDSAMTFSTKQEPAARLEVFKFEGSQQLQQSADQGATRINEQETQHDRDSRWACSALSDPHVGRISFSDTVRMYRNNRSALLHADSDSPILCRARREAVLRQATQGAGGDGEYKGMNSYVDYHKGFRREHTIGSEKGSGGCCRAIALHERWATCKQIKDASLQLTLWSRALDSII